jgi:hypothetical protein
MPSLCLESISGATAGPDSGDHEPASVAGDRRVEWPLLSETATESHAEGLETPRRRASVGSVLFVGATRSLAADPTRASRLAHIAVWVFNGGTLQVVAPVEADAEEARWLEEVMVENENGTGELR